MFTSLRGAFFKGVKKVCNCKSRNASTSPKLKERYLYQEQTIKIGEWNINYVKVGNGPHTVLCVPGPLGTIWTHLKGQVEGLDRDKFTIVALDPAGYGKSRPPLRDFPVNFYLRDALITHEFMKSLEIPKYSLLGWSDGGITGMILAAKYPEAMNKLVVWGASAFFLPHEIEIYRSLSNTFILVRREMNTINPFNAIHAIITIYERCAPEARIVLDKMNINEWSAGIKGRMIDFYGEELFTEYFHKWTEGIDNVYKTKNGNICTDYLAYVRCPTLVLAGGRDAVIDSVHPAHLQVQIKDARLHLYPEGKHDIHITHTEDFNKRVQEFLQG